MGLPLANRRTGLMARQQVASKFNSPCSAISECNTVLKHFSEIRCRMAGSGINQNGKLRSRTVVLLAALCS